MSDIDIDLAVRKAQMRIIKKNENERKVLVYGAVFSYTFWV